MSSFRIMPAGPDQPWFRLGRLEVGTVMLVVLATVASWIAWVVAPGAPGALYFTPELVLNGEIWRLVTWPLASSLSLWGVLNLFFFWYFGSDLEGMIGRGRMGWLLGGIAASLLAAALIVGSLLRVPTALAGIDGIEFIVLLLWIAEYPTRRFLFNIPAWAFGAVLLALQVLPMLAARAWGQLLSLLIGLVLVALVAKACGLLGDYAWIPGGARRRRPRPARQPAAPRVSRSEQRVQNRRTSDRERLDELLDRINDNGIGSLTDRERQELMKLRDRLRGGR
ncbi:rhomboid family intramembrane serine protease [Nigerium massiliense]|uniref:rhomboid family intramembrane serine protease n=1 Tax=Nigerium massiliense TaxID=1522317 RepID=UPI0011C78B8B|nr:rhomboid family intramembrane serine protease [Nigerium massiliense]